MTLDLLNHVNEYHVKIMALSANINSLRALIKKQLDKGFQLTIQLHHEGEEVEPGDPDFMRAMAANIYGLGNSPFLRNGFYPYHIQKETTISNSYQLSDTVTIKLLNMMLQEMKLERKTLIDEVVQLLPNIKYNQINEH